MIYAAFTLWLFLILFTGMGVYRLWSRMVKPDWVNWALLPGTVVSEMGYIFGSLITGAEVRRAKLLPAKADSPSKGGKSEPTVEEAGGLKVLTPIIASLLGILACIAAIILFRSLLGTPVIDTFVGPLSQVQVAKQLPLSADAFWTQLEQQVRLLRRMYETWWGLNWVDWRVPLFVYLAICLSVRIAPVTRPLRPTLIAAAVVAALIALTGLISSPFCDVMSDLWGLLTYLWANLLFLLVVTLLLGGAVRLGKVLFGKGG